MGKVFFDVGITLDGYIAGPNARPGNPLGDGGLQVHEWDIESALEQARAAAGDKDVRISGGAQTIREYLRAGLIDEFSLHIAPLMLGRGNRLFEGLYDVPQVEQVNTSSFPLVTHIDHKILPAQ